MKKILFLSFFCVLASHLIAQEFTTLPVNINGQTEFDKSYIKKSGTSWMSEIKFGGKSSLVIQLKDCPNYMNLKGVGSSLINKEFIVSESTDGSSFNEILKFKGGWSNVDRNNIALQATTRYIKIQYDASAGVGDIASIYIAANMELTSSVPSLITDRYNEVSTTVRVKGNKLGGDVALSCANTHVTITPATLTQAEAIAGADVTVTYTPAADKTDTVVLRATDSSNTDSYDETSLNVTVQTAPTEYLMSLETMEYISTTEAIPSQEITLRGISIDETQTVTVSGDYLIRKKGDEVYSKSLDLVPVKGLIDATILEVNYEKTADDVRNGFLTFGSEQTNLILLSPNALTVEAISAKTYGDDPFDFVAASSNSVTPFEYSFSTPNVIEIENGKLKIKNAGEVIFTVTQPKGNGFLAATATVSVTVNQAALTLKANDAERIFGENNSQFAYTLSGLKYTDSASVITKQPTYTCLADATSFGFFDITPADAACDNYVITYESGKLNIRPKPITIILGEISKKIYGEIFDLPSVTTENTEVEVLYSIDNENVAVIENGKVKVVAPGKAQLIATQAGNEKYAATTATTELVVEKAMLIVKAHDYTRQQTESNPEFEVSYEGFVTGDDEWMLDVKPSFSCDAANVAGDFAIIPSGASSSKYDFTYVNGNLRVLSGVSSESKTMNQGNYYSAGYLYLNPSVQEVAIFSINGTFSMKVSNPTTLVNLTALVAGKYIVTLLIDGKTSSFLISK